MAHYTTARTIAAGIALSAAGCALAQGRISVQGRIEGVEKGRLLILAQKAEGKVDTIASAGFTAPDFKIAADIAEPAAATLAVEGYSGGFPFIAEPGEDYEALLTNSGKWHILGGKLQDSYAAFAQRMERIRERAGKLRAQADSLLAEMKYMSASRVNEAIDSLRRSMALSRDSFLTANDNIIAANEALLAAKAGGFGYEEAKRMYEGLGTEAKNSLSGRILKEVVDRLGQTAKGSVAPDFTLPTADGSTFTLSKMGGRVKIVDFWASWCGPCRMNNPHLKKMYEAYHGKGLEIVGVSLDDNRGRWLQAVEKDGLPWTQASSLKGWRDDTAKAYGVTAVPAIFILDTDNRIIAKDLRHDALEAFLADRLGKPGE